ncbi:MAG: hypothetical protein GXP38_12630 [Chloroflexi bacterium]|nr:hypothetical protein [Chloroflexota bacterium]
MIREPKQHLSFKNAWLWLLLALFLIFVIVVLTKISTSPTLKAEAAAPSAPPVNAQEAVIAQLSTSPTQSTLAQVTATENTPALLVDTPSSDNCISCHTDKDKLKALAEEPEKVKSTEASGEG